MSALKLDLPESPIILFLGAHGDDLEIGACATILELAEAYPSARAAWIVFSAVGERAAEARSSARYCTRGFSDSEIELHTFRDGYFPYHAGEIKDCFEAIKARWQPDLVLTHYRDDLHQDHRLISDLSWQTFRNQLILEYEIPKYDGDLGSPNFFVAVSDGKRDEKLAILERYFASQASKAWFTPDTFLALMRIRGVECRSETGFAEAFYCRKAVLQTGS